MDYFHWTLRGVIRGYWIFLISVVMAYVFSTAHGIRIIPLLG